MARANSKTANAIAIMNANSELPIDAVVPMIAAKLGVDERIARNYYLWAVRKGVAKGAAKREKVKVTVAPKFISSKDEEEIAASKARNLELMREVTNRRSAKHVALYGDRVAATSNELEDPDFDPEAAREEVDRMLEERDDIKDIVPLFLHKELGLI